MLSTCIEKNTIISNKSVVIEPVMVSVIIPSYNHAKYIEEAIRSVWNQTYKNIELIVIDDGSKDQSVNILNKLQLESPIRMRVVAKKNEGICKTLNFGLNLSSGKYISVLASDDRYLNNKFALLVPIIESSDCNVSFVYSKNTNINEDGSISIVRQKELAVIKDQLFENILLFKIFPTISSALIKKNILIEVGSFNEKYKTEDYDLLLRLTRGHTALFCNQPTFEYRGGVIGSLGKNVSMHYMDLVKSFNDNIRYSKKSHAMFWVRYGYGRLYSRIAESFYMNYDVKSSRHWALKSILKNPLQWKAYRLYMPSLLGSKIISYIRNRRLYD